MERYSRGRRGHPAKVLVRATAARVQISLSPPKESHTKQVNRFVSYFYLWDCFGIVVNYERPKTNFSHLNYKHKKRDEHGNFSK